MSAIFFIFTNVNISISSAIPLCKVKLTIYPKRFIVIRITFTQIFGLCLFVEVCNIIKLFFMVSNISSGFSFVCLTVKSI